MTSLALWLAVTGFTICACVGAMELLHLARTAIRRYLVRRDLRKMFGGEWP